MDEIAWMGKLSSQFHWELNRTAGWMKDGWAKRSSFSKKSYSTTYNVISLKSQGKMEKIEINLSAHKSYHLWNEYNKPKKKCLFMFLRDKILNFKETRIKKIYRALEFSTRSLFPFFPLHTHTLSSKIHIINHHT